jgi:cytolysin (calcineurin-like family phosphatase)
MRRWLLAIAVSGMACLTQARDVTFLVTSDSHFDAFENEDRNDRVRATILRMNAVTGEVWSAKLGGDAIAAPRGVLLLGDVIDDGDRMFEGRNQSAAQNAHFLELFGLDGADGLLKYPVFEGWGNHDGPPVGAEKHGFSFQAQLKERNRARLSRKLIGHVSENGLHYSWDWDDVHFVQLNIYPADRQNPSMPRYNPVWHNPQDALAFLKQDLAERVGASGRPVVLASHCGFDTDWWLPEDWKAAYDAAKSYNIILYLFGHTGTGVWPWAPPGEDRKWDCVNTGQTEKGFFVVQITDRRVRLGYRCKDTREEKGPDGKTRLAWDGEWMWRCLLDKPLSASDP